MTMDSRGCDLTGAWTVSVSIPSPDGGRIVASVDVPRPEVVTVHHEPYERLPLFNLSAWAGWQRGRPLAGLKAQECTACFALHPDSVVVAAGSADDATRYERGLDWEADLAWGSVGRLPGGRIGPEQPVFISYAYTPARLDSIVQDATGAIALRRGEPHIATPHPPALSEGEARLVNVFLERQADALAADCLYPILESGFPEPTQSGASVAERLLPRTLARLVNGEPLKVLAWGDSVTDGGFLDDPARERWQCQFVERLRERYPKSPIDLVTEAWGGRNTSLYLAEPPGSIHNYQEKVLDAKPDLIVMEFVNDAGLPADIYEERHRKLLEDFRRIGAEWIILTPHYIRPDWMGLTRQREIDEDPRPYVAFLRKFAAENDIALADASLRYGRLWRQGIPYNTMMKNNVNHPDARGMRIFADSLIALFPGAE